MRTRRAWLVALTAVLVGHMAVAVEAISDDRASATAVEADAPPNSARPGSLERATSDARTSGKRVEIVDRRSEVGEVFANPDGTLTSQTHAVPVRVRRSAGWIPVDTTLSFGPDGAVVPRATSTPMRLAGGGDAPLVMVGSGDRQMRLSWPGALPTPSLTGSSATYRSVLPGVDLRMQVTATGFSQVLVVHSAEAAKNPRLRTVRFGLSLSAGLSVRTDRQGNPTVVDTKGEVVFGSSAPVMWDSTAAAGAGRELVGGPEDGSRRAIGSVQVGRDEMILRPAISMLTDPATRWPVYIDPPWSAPRDGWTEVAVVGGRPITQPKWNGANDEPGVAKVGYSDWQSPTVLYRSYFQFNTLDLVGKQVLSAEFNIRLTYTPSCNPTKVNGWGSGRVSTNTIWDGQPGGTSLLGQHSVDACKTGYIGFTAGPWVASMAQQGSWSTTFLLRADNESNKYEWKKFDPSSAVLNTTYNSLPSAPTSQTVAGRTCAIQPNEPYTSESGPELAAVMSDPERDTVSAQFEYYVKNGAKVGELWAAAPSGTTARVKVPQGTYGDGVRMSFRVRGWDGNAYGAWGSWCDMTVDRSAPTKAPSVSSAGGLYPECGTGGSVGRTGEFNISANGETDVVGFRYGLNNGSTPEYVPALQLGGGATVQVTPDEEGPANLYVRSVDRAGNPGPIYVSPCGLGAPGVGGGYYFKTGAGSPPVAHWRGDGVDVVNVPDTSERGAHSGSFPIGGGIVAGRHKQALWLNGTNGHVNTANGAAVSTVGSYSVGAWVKLDRLGPNAATAVSQDGRNLSSFLLQYRGGSGGRWVFMLPNTDCQSCASASPTSTRTAQIGVWTHLVGVYDAGAKQAKLYVDGVLNQAVPFTSAWPSTGSVQLGRAKFAGVFADYFPGALDDVRIYDRALSNTEIHDLATMPSNEELFLPFDEGTGPIASDASGNYRTGTLSATGVARLGPPGKVGEGSLRLDGSGSVTTAQPAVRTDGSFTASALVRLDEASGQPGVPKPVTQTVLSQDGSRSAGFALQYQQATGGWSFQVATADADSPAWIRADSPGVAQAGEWVHLAGVYDAAAGEVRLYVGGVLAATATGRNTANVAGNLVAGRIRRAGVSTDYLRGMLDDVHVWTGVRTSDQIMADQLDPVTVRDNAHTGQFARYRGGDGYFFNGSGMAPLGAHFGDPIGLPGPDGDPLTRYLYSCLNGTSDQFLSADPLCEGAKILGAAGSLYMVPPPDLPVAPVWRCSSTGQGHFLSHDPHCEGRGIDGLLGYAQAFAKLVRYRTPGYPNDQMSTAFSPRSEYDAEFSLGLVALSAQPGTTPLMICQDGTDIFSSIRADCEGKATVRPSGHIWTTAPTDVAESAQLFRCRMTSTGERFDSLDPDCEGNVVETPLGYLVTRR
ncbi:LamG-like jellyroll fold domain-containing protein [Micromonospora sp. NPDC005324]|uniref:LamG-like jellyroll fold domain-containing protein n=1 Tax=Micromonospora sp. NPDC005324 TaxID=3157033 RepID=UPI0033B70DDF